MNSTSPICQKCPVGFFQDAEGMTECEPCPEFHSTLQSGATELTQCLRKLQVFFYECILSIVLHYCCSEVPSDCTMCKVQFDVPSNKFHEVFSVGIKKMIVTLVVKAN